MLILLIVIAAIVLLAVGLGLGGGFGGGGPVIRRRIVYRRPARRIITEHRIVEDPAAPVDGPGYRP